MGNATILESGVYMIACRSNDKKYIGSTINLSERYKQHFSKLRKQKSHNILLQRAYDKYGKDSFNFIVLERCNIGDLKLKEQYWIQHYNTYIDGFNLTDKTVAFWRGMKHSPESIKKITISQLKAQTPAMRANKSLIMKKRWENEEWRKMMTKVAFKTHKGKLINSRQIERFKETIAKKYPNGRPAWNKGKKNIYTAETITRMRTSALKKAPITEITRAKISYNTKLGIHNKRHKEIKSKNCEFCKK